MNICRKHSYSDGGIYSNIIWEDIEQSGSLFAEEKFLWFFFSLDTFIE